MSTIDVRVALTEIVCGECSGVYAITEPYRKSKHEKGGFWHCPYCNTDWGYPKDGSLNEQLQKKLTAERAAHDQTKAARDEAQRQAVAERARVEHEEKRRKKAEKRAACGVCPYCKRSFASTRMAAHVKTKHPEYAHD